MAIALIPNNKFDAPFLDRLCNYTEQSFGAVRTIQFVQKPLKIVNQIADTTPHMHELVRNTGIGLSALNFTRVFSVTSDMIRSLNDITWDDSFAQRAVKAVRDTLEAVSVYAYSFMFLVGTQTLKNLAQVADIGYDFSDLQMSYSHYSKAAEREERTTGDEREALSHSKNYYLYRIAKDVSSLAATALGLAVLATGSSMIALAALVTSFANTIIAFRRDFYKEEGRFKVVSFT
jgi:hypothetical protein